MLRDFSMAVMVAGMVLVSCSAAQAQVNMVYITVGDPGNVGELSGAGAGGYGPDRVCGAVDYTYKIGKYEVTNAQYSEFLNAVANLGDPYVLYNPNMGAGWDDIGGICRSGSRFSCGPRDHLFRKR